MDDRKYFSFIEQTLHYFDRPHRCAAVQPVDCVAAWRGDNMPPLQSMAYHLSADEVAEILLAVEFASGLEKPVKELTAVDFRLPLLTVKIAQWREQLADGLGFQVVRGVPAGQLTQEQAELFFWCFGLHLGQPGEQNPEGHLLGHVADTGASSEDPMVRLYKTAANIEYHCDAADVVGLLCLHKAKAGGHSRIVSSVTVFNELISRRPDLAQRLFAPVQLDIRDKDVDEAGSTLPIQPCCYDGEKLRTFYHADYFRSVTRHADIPYLSGLEQELFDTYEAIAAEPGMYLDMDLEPGDIQLLSNHTNLHARTEYVDFEDPGQRRHLLRLWLSL